MAIIMTIVLVKKEFWTLTEVSRLFAEPQHRLIYYCEEGIIKPAAQEGTGRGSSRKFSLQNLFQFALCLSLKEVYIPSALWGFVLKTLDEFNKKMESQLSGFSLPEFFWEKDKPDIRVIISDGSKLFFVIYSRNKKPRVIGGLEMKKTRKNEKLDADEIIEFLPPTGGIKDIEAGGFGYPEGSSRGRTEVSLLQVCQDLKERIVNDKIT